VSGRDAPYLPPELPALQQLDLRRKSAKGFHFFLKVRRLKWLGLVENY